MKNDNSNKDVQISIPEESWSPLGEELTDEEVLFLDLVDKCDLPGVKQLLAENQVNINIKNYEGITPLHLAIKNNCEPMVDLILHQKDVQIGDSVLLAVTYDALGLLAKLLDHVDTERGGGVANDRRRRIESEEFPASMSPLALAALCGRYETIEYLMSRGHRLRRPHATGCTCAGQCAAVDTEVAACVDRINTYKALCSPAYLCCTCAADPVLACFRLHDELLERGKYEKVYETVYASMAMQVRRFAVNMVVNCRTSDEVKLLLGNRDGCEYGGPFPYPRLVAAMDRGQKEFVSHVNVQQVLESAWTGQWTEWRSYSTVPKCAYPAWRLLVLPLTVLVAVLVPPGSARASRPPVVRMFDSVAAYSVFLALLLAHSNADKYRTPRGVPATWPWALVGLFVVGHAFEKVKLFLVLGSRRYFRDTWNTFDTVELTLFALAYVAWAVAGFQSFWVNVDLDRKYWHWADPQLVAEGLFAVATVMAYARLLFLCQLNRYAGPMQVSVAMVLGDLAKFGALAAVIVVAFTCGLATLYGPYAGMVRKDPDTGQVTWQQDSFVTVADTFGTLFWGIFCMTSVQAPDVVVGNMDDDGPRGGDGGRRVVAPSHGFTELVGYGLFTAFEVTMVIVILNMLIASMSNTFQRVADNSRHEWLYGRAKVYVNYMLLDDLPPPFNLLPTVAQLVRVARRLFTGAAAYKSRYGDRDVDGGGGGDHDDDGQRRQSKYCALMAELIRRFLVHDAQTPAAPDGPG